VASAHRKSLAGANTPETFQKNEKPLATKTAKKSGLILFFFNAAFVA